MKMKTLFAAFLSVGLALSPPVAIAAADGTAVGVDPDAVARINSTDRVLLVGAEVSMGETVTTGPRGRVQLLFADETKIVVGPGSSLKIETYLMNGNTADKLAIRALGGTFRFISGVSPKSAYSIHTPTAAIAVRGTSFDLSVDSEGTKVLLFDGALSVCRASSCVDLIDRCDLAIADTSRSQVFRWDDSGRGNMARAFPIAVVQSVLLRPFRIPAAGACLTDMPPAAQSLSNGPGGEQGSQPSQNSGTTPTNISSTSNTAPTPAAGRGGKN